LYKLESNFVLASAIAVFHVVPSNYKKLQLPQRYSADQWSLGLRCLRRSFKVTNFKTNIMMIMVVVAPIESPNAISCSE